jgi:hypothetical protein
MNWVGESGFGLPFEACSYSNCIVLLFIGGAYPVPPRGFTPNPAQNSVKINLTIDYDL